MHSNNKLFLDLLKKFHKHGILQHLVIIGSWALPIYQHYFAEYTDIPIMRTMDFDLLVVNSPKIIKQVDVNALLENSGFSLVHSIQDGFEKYIHPQLEVEFLTQELGRGNRKSTYVHHLNIKAQPLRYQHFALDHVIKVDFYGMKVVVTEPTIYLLLKGIISGERPISQKEKAMKDLSVVSSFGHYLVSIPKQRKLLQYYYRQMPKPWQKKFVSATEEVFPEFVTICKSE